MVSTSFEFLDKKITVNGLGDDHIFKIISGNKSFYEQELLNLIGILPCKAGVFLDIGANIGNHTLFFTKVLGRNVISVEPNPITMQFLVDNIACNYLDNNVTVYDKPIGESLDDLYDSISVSDVNLGMHKFTKTDSQNSKITGETIDNIAKGKTVSLIKIDVEGAELSALKGAKDTLATHKPVLIIEAGSMLEKNKIIGYVSSLGYHLMTIKCATDTLVFVHQDDNLSIYRSVVDAYDNLNFQQSMNKTLKSMNRGYNTNHSEVVSAVNQAVSDIDKNIHKVDGLIQSNHTEVVSAVNQAVSDIDKNIHKVDGLIQSNHTEVVSAVNQAVSDIDKNIHKVDDLINSVNRRSRGYNRAIELLENNNKFYIQEIENLKGENALIKKETLFYRKKSDILETKVEFLFNRIKKANPIVALFCESFQQYKKKLNQKLNVSVLENKKKRIRLSH